MHRTGGGVTWHRQIADDLADAPNPLLLGLVQVGRHLGLVPSDEQEPLAVLAEPADLPTVVEGLDGGVAGAAGGTRCRSSRRSP